VVVLLNDLSIGRRRSDSIAYQCHGRRRRDG